MSLTRVLVLVAMFATVAGGSEPDFRLALGVPVIPGATVRNDQQRQDSDKGAISLEDVTAASVTAEIFVSPQSPQKVLNFYRSEFQRLGDVTECKAGKNTHVHVRLNADAISDPTACHAEDFGKDDTELKVVKGSDQFVISVSSAGKGSEFAIVHVESARKCPPSRCSEMM